MHRLFPTLFLLLVACALPPAEPTAHSSTGTPASEPARRSAREPVLLVSVPEKVAEGEGRFKADWSFDLRATEAFSVHVHVIPPEQLVPLHRHPDNEELALVLGGVAHWETTWKADIVRSDAWVAGFGEAVFAPPGSAHQVRNRGSEMLATVVVQRPEFGQNWYVPADEVKTPLRAGPFADGELRGFRGWTVAWRGGDESEVRRAHESFGFVVEGEGSLRFEDTVLPLLPGHFYKVPPGLAHAVEGDLRRLVVVTDRGSAAPIPGSGETGG